MRVTVSAVALASGSIKIIRVVHGLDFSAILAVADDMGARSDLLSELLPEIEAIIVRACNQADD
jgi:hypothetical protein